MLVLRGVHGIACASLGAQQHQRSRSLCFASRVLEPTAPRPTCARLMSASSSGGAPPQQSSDSTSPPSAEGSLEQDLRLYAELCSHVPSDALKECIPGVCPWCCLHCIHGDVAGALSSTHSRKRALSPDAHRGRFILKHSITWILERARLDVLGELETVTEITQRAPRPVRPSDDHTAQRPWQASATAAGGSSGSSSTLPAPFSVFASRVPPPPTTADHPASRAPPRPHNVQAPPLPPPPGLEIFDKRSESWSIWMPPPQQTSDAGSQRTREEPRPVMRWEYWGGKTTRWAPYDDHVSAELSNMVSSGRRSAVFVIAGSRYEIDVVSCTQNNVDTDLNPRTIRATPTIS